MKALDREGRGRAIVLLAALALGLSSQATLAADIPPPRDEPYPATITLESGVRIVGRVKAVEGGRVVMQTWYKEVSYPVAQVATVERDDVGVMLAARRPETIVFMSEVDEDAARDLVKRTSKLTMGKKFGKAHVTVMSGVRIGADFGIKCSIEGRGDFVFLIPKRPIEKSSREKLVFDPVVLGRVKRLKPGDKVKVHWYAAEGGDEVWIAPGEEGIIGGEHLEGELPPSLAAEIHRLQPEERKHILGLSRLGDRKEVALPGGGNPAAKAAMLLLADKVDMNREPEPSLGLLAKLMEQSEPDEVPVEVYDVLVRGAVHPYNGVVARGSAALLAWSGYSDFIPVLEDAVEFRKGSSSAKEIGGQLERLERSRRHGGKQAPSPAREAPVSQADLNEAMRLVLSTDKAEVTTGANRLAELGRPKDAIKFHQKVKNYLEAALVAKEMGAPGLAADYARDEMIAQERMLGLGSPERLAKAKALFTALNPLLNGTRGHVSGAVMYAAGEGTILIILVHSADHAHSSLVGLPVRFAPMAAKIEGGGALNAKHRALIGKLKEGDRLKIGFVWQNARRIENIERQE